MMWLIWIVSLALLNKYSSAEIRISLNSGEAIKWTVKNDSSSEVKWATVPGGIYSDLGLAKDLLYDFNDINYKWVGYENWTYETKFTLSQDILNMFAVNLVFHGIDTIGDVYLNGQLVQSVDNMFVRYVIPIKHAAQAGLNTLEVRLKSPFAAAAELAQANGYKIPSYCLLPDRYGSECNINFLRKMQASFGWSWAPIVPSVGIWKPVEIEAFNKAVVRNIGSTIRKENDTWIVDVEYYCEGINEGYGYVTGLSLLPSNPKISNLRNDDIRNITYSEKVSEDNNYTHFVYRITTTFSAERHQAWWPNGYGSQPRWKLTCELISAAENGSVIESSSRWTVTGLRTVELVEEKKGESSLVTFYFKINDVPIFAKGANWIPSHILPELASDEKMIIKLLQSAKDANMNMLRVSGSGIYESDKFYEIADELGILIWQDLMFSSALYPTNEEFLQSVSLEVDQQIKRLKAHPSVVIWNGNSEIEDNLANNRFQIKNQTQYIQDYITLFVDTIKPILDLRDPSRYYTISSPSNGNSRTGGGSSIDRIPNNPYLGDMHYFNYNYKIDIWDNWLYPRANFISEYGFQSMPSLPTLSKAFKTGDFKLSSPISKSRQHLQNGYDIMQGLIKSKLTSMENDESQEFYEQFIYYSQIIQAMTTKIETEIYRRQLSGEINTKSMGALFNQLNDVWQAPTWSSIEYGGRWKMLHYYAAKFFAPVIVVPQLFNGYSLLRIYGISDRQNDDTCELSIALYSWDSLTPKLNFVETKQMRGLSSNLLVELDLEKLLDIYQCNVTTCFLYVTLKGDEFFTDNFLILSISFEFVTTLKPATLKTIVRQSNRKNEVEIDIITDTIAPFVWLETEVDGTFSDNGFIQVTDKKTITFSNKEETSIDIEKFTNTLKVKSLLNNNNGAGRLASNMIIVPLLITFLNYAKKLW